MLDERPFRFDASPGLRYTTCIAHAALHSARRSVWPMVRRLAGVRLALPFPFIRLGRVGLWAAAAPSWKSPAKSRTRTPTMAAPAPSTFRRARRAAAAPPADGSAVSPRRPHTSPFALTPHPPGGASLLWYHGHMPRKLKTVTIKQGAMLPGAPHQVYELLMDSTKHAAFSGGETQISRKVGGSFHTFDGWASGKNIELVPDQKIVQTWRGDDWPAGHYSTVKFQLIKAPQGTKLLFTQTDVPASVAKDIAKGWREYYWEPMKQALIE